MKKRSDKFITPLHIGCFTKKLLFSLYYLKRYAHGYSVLHHLGDVGVYALFEAFPAALLHVAPAGLGNGHGAWKSHVCDAVDVSDGLGPHCSHHTLYVCLLLGWQTVAGVETVTLLQCCHRHAPVVEFG